MKNKIRYIIIFIIFILTIIFSTFFINYNKKNLIITDEIVQTDIEEIQESQDKNKEYDEYIQKLQEQIDKFAEMAAVAAMSQTYRLTSYYNGDGCNSGSCTGSGLCEKDFEVDEHGWYTYQGKLVLASATTYLLKNYAKRDNITYHKYYDTITVNIKGQNYEGIILDSCGACMKKNIIDLFVSNKQSAITMNIKVN